eukprot:4838193-Ditylum_brightwellii.AAC.1
MATDLSRKCRENENAEMDLSDGQTFLNLKGSGLRNELAFNETDTFKRLLEIETGKLDSMLNHLLKTVNYHTMMIEKLPTLEETQSSLQSGLNELKLGLSSEGILSTVSARQNEDVQGRKTCYTQKRDEKCTKDEPGSNIPSSISEVCDERKDTMEASIKNEESASPP